jgi:hypothetical protein
MIGIHMFKASLAFSAFVLPTHQSKRADWTFPVRSDAGRGDFFNVLPSDDRFRGCTNAGTLGSKATRHSGKSEF